MASATLPVPIETPRNPADLGYPKTLPVEVAMGEVPIPRICEAYGLTRDDWNRLRLDERFRNEVSAAKAMLQKEGMSFKIKAQMQAEALLATTWKMIHRETTPPAVAADLIKFTTRVAHYDPMTAPKDGSLAAGGAALGAQFNIQINLG